MTNATQSALRGQPRDPGGKAGSAFGGIDKSAVRRTPGSPDYQAIQQSVEYIDLKRRVKWFVFPMTAFFLVWYIGYVVVAAYARDILARPLFGEINLGLVLGVGQFATTLIITMLYVRYATRHIDPRVDEIRRDLDGAES